MKEYDEPSYDPSNLSIGFSGKSGEKGEPENALTGLIEQNVLIQAYEKPLSAVELSKKMGVATAYVEDAMARLLKLELLKVYGNNKVYTNFLIVDLETMQKKQNLTNEFAKRTYAKTTSILDSLVHEYTKLKVFNDFAPEQLHLYAILSIAYYTRLYLIEKLKLKNIAEYPDRLDKGSWMIDAGLMSSEKEDHIKFIYAHEQWMCNYFNGLSSKEWEKSYGKFYQSILSPGILIEERIKILYDISKSDDIDLRYMPLIPDLRKLKFLSECSDKNNKCEMTIPVLNENDFTLLQEINKRHSDMYIDACGENLIKFIKENQLKHPSWIDSSQLFLNLSYLSALPAYFVEHKSEVIA